MATFHFDLVSPEKIAFSGEVDQVDIPGLEGDFGVLAGHAPLVAALKPGIMTVSPASGQKERIIVLGGLAEVSANGLTVLADVATSIEDLDRASFDRTISEMEQDIAELAQGSELDKAITRLDHFKTIRDHIETTGMH
jgi:F-type H+-transporting ATPase subunit epsilon